MALKFSRNAAGRQGARMIDRRSDILDASILIVDDQEANVSLLEQMLQRGRLHRASPRPWTRTRSARCTARTATT